MAAETAGNTVCVKTFLQYVSKKWKKKKKLKNAFFNFFFFFGFFHVLDFSRAAVHHVGDNWIVQRI